ncbi:MAG: hypothetical protein KF779_14085 [Hyphomonadaceae bacterium]|nr:hypothetical protein [Hyphomonadaceae bacterium]MCA8886688.1 hypothetical protein [Hyphomonadaceae bacterium]
MPVVLRHNEQLELNIAEYRGSVSFTELKAVADFLAQNPSFLKSDCLSLVAPGADFVGVELDALDQLFGRYAKLYEPINFQIMRRSAWLCFSPAAQAHVDHWSGKRDARESMSTTLRQFSSYEEAGDWLILSEAETIALQTNAGFEELARFEDAPAISQTRAR